MSDEIKETLEALRDSIDDTGTDKVNFINWVDKIEDCITNLQDKEKLGEIFKKYYEDEVEKTNKLQDRNIELVLERDKYKSRNEKAIKYIEQEAVFYDSYDGEDTMLEELCERYYKELLNILNGGDDNE